MTGKCSRRDKKRILKSMDSVTSKEGVDLEKSSDIKKVVGKSGSAVKQIVRMFRTKLGRCKCKSAAARFALPKPKIAAKGAKKLEEDSESEPRPKSVSKTGDGYKTLLLENVE